jgi:hypothetical protein
MEGNSGIATTLVQVIFYLLVIVTLYYFYKYLFGRETTNSALLVDSSRQANTDAGGEIVVTSANMPRIYEGGEFTVSMWVYINNWSYRQTYNKHIMSIGGTNFDTLRVYLAPDRNNLNVRVHTAESSTTANADSTTSLPASQKTTLFANPQTGAQTIEGSGGCGINEIDMQRWVNVVISLNGRTCDVYIDGKLARSCVLPSFYKVDPNGYSATLLSNGGFGGFIAGVSVYDSALNPDIIYKNYIAGPEPVNNIGEWFKSFFEPKRIV